MVDIGVLILAVNERPCLWNQYCKEYYNRDQVARSWKQIGSILGVKWELAKSKWKHLRDNYRAELKKVLKSADGEDGEEPRYKTSWVWFESLDFLREFVFSKGTRNNRMSAAFSDSSTTSTVNIKVEPDFDVDNDDEPSVSSEQSEVQYRDDSDKRKRVLRYEADTEDSGSKRLRAEEVVDGNFHFAMSILPSIRKLPVQSQMLVKAKIHDLIYQEYLKANNDNST